MKYIIYYIVVGFFLLLSDIVGRRAGCHTICWMAPLMILGRKLRNIVNWPALHLKAETENCINCRQCTQNCPMSLDVNAMVQVLPFHHDLAPIPGTSTILPKHLTIFNGSPRRPKGNTPLMLQQVMKGFSVDEQRFAQPFVEITE